MRCAECGSMTRIASEINEDAAVKRVRMCYANDHRFTTVEAVPAVKRGRGRPRLAPPSESEVHILERIDEGKRIVSVSDAMILRGWVVRVDDGSYAITKPGRASITRYYDYARRGEL